MGKCFAIGQAAGIRFVVHGSFFLPLAWMAGKGIADGGDLPALAGTLGLLLQTLLCVLLHEGGHAAAARLAGAPVRKIVLIPLLGQPLLTQPPATARQRMAVDLAGPGVNLLVAALLLAVVPVPSPGELLFAWPDPGRPALALLTTNLWLGLVNLLPVLPTDAGRVLRDALTPALGFRRATDCLAVPGQLLGIALVLWGAFGWYFLVLLGLLLLFGGQFEREAAQGAEWLEGIRVKDVMDTHFVCLAPDTTVEEAAEHFSRHPYCRYGFIFGDGGVVGAVSGARLPALARSGPQLPLHYLMHTEVEETAAGEPLSRVCSTLRWRTGMVYPVTREGKIVGALCPDQLSRMMRLAVEQEPVAPWLHEVEP